MSELENNIDEQVQEPIPQEEKTFTQSQLDKILSDRLMKEKARHNIELNQFKEALALKEKVANVTVRLGDLGISCPVLAQSWGALSTEELEANMKNLTASIAKAINDGVDKRLRGNAPQKPSPTNENVGLRSAFKLP